MTRYKRRYIYLIEISRTAFETEKGYIELFEDLGEITIFCTVLITIQGDAQMQKDKIETQLPSTEQQKEKKR
jgi:hypothetical protein